MKIRKAKEHELDLIYSMGFDAWSSGLSLEKYLVGCRKSKKYAAGTWYVLVEKDEIVSSLIVYNSMFNLKEGCFGIGSVATFRELRHKGYASRLINLVKSELFDSLNCKALYLHSDIDRQFYSRLGFVSIQGSDSMIYSNSQVDFEGSLPTYF